VRASHAQLRATARRTLRRLDLAPPLDPRELAARLGEERGKPIHLVPSTELPPAAAFGVTGGDESRDVVLYEARTSATSQMLIILHELAHIVLEHPRSAVDHSFRADRDGDYETFSADVLAELVGPPPPDPEPGTRWPWRRGEPAEDAAPPSLYASDIEWEAETLATILLTWVPGYGNYVPPRQVSPLEQVLGDDGAW
jgi:hypothetical protein